MTAHSDDDGRLCIGEVPLTDVADEFGTPTYVIDEADFRTRARSYRAALGDTEVLYAGKSLLTIAVARWAHEEGLGIDVCSAGELAIAMAGAWKRPASSCTATRSHQDDLRAAVRFGVGRIVLDSTIEITDLAGMAEGRQRVLIRVTPDLDIHGHRAVTTGISDQKFGFTLDGGHAADAVARVLSHTEPAADRIALSPRLAGHRRGDLRRGDPPDDRRNGRCPRSARRDPDRAEHRWRPRGSVSGRRLRS